MPFCTGYLLSISTNVNPSPLISSHLSLYQLISSILNVYIDFHIYPYSSFLYQSKLFYEFLVNCLIFLIYFIVQLCRSVFYVYCNPNKIYIQSHFYSKKMKNKHKEKAIFFGHEKVKRKCWVCNVLVRFSRVKKEKKRN